MSKNKNHKPYDDRELQQADATAYALGELSAAETKQFERSQAMSGESATDSASEMEKVRRLGQLLRADIVGDVAGVGSTSGESIRCSNQIRESVLAALDAQETNLPPKLVKPALTVVRRSRTRIWAWGLVASVAIAVGGFIIWSGQNNQTQTAQSRFVTSQMERLTKRVEPGSGQEIRIIIPEAPQPSGQAGSVESSLADFDAKLVESLGYERGLSEKKDAGSATPELVDLRGGITLNGQLRESSIAPQPAPDGSLGNASPQRTTNFTVRAPQNATKNVPDGGTIMLGGIVRDSEGDQQERSESQRLTDQFGTGESVPRIEIAKEESIVQGFGMGEPRIDSSGDVTEREKALGESLNRRIDRQSEMTGERSNEQYKSVPENPFWRPIGERAMSTFSIDVDTASYANVRRFLNEGSLPPPDAVRLEEFINYFHYDYPQPEEGVPFAVDLKLFGCPWNAQHSLLRVGLHGREIEAEKRPISNIVYLVDVSGSMSDENKLPLLKRGLAMMVDHLSENDTVSIVTYAGEAGVRLEPTNGANKKRILDAIDSLQSGGSTNGAAGIEVAYRLAQQKFVQEGANRVILMTDGDLNVGVTSDEALVTLIKEKAAGGVFLTVLGFGTGNLKDAKLEGLADNGNGIYGYIDSLGEAHKVVVEQMSGNLVTIAKDVKIQIEFNPAQVAGYRLIGYENRVMANQDFANDRKDAGEIGAGHTVTALYEIVPAGAMLGVIDPSSATLKYQTVDSAPRGGDAQPKTDVQLTEAAGSGELASVALRFKTPEGTESRLVEFTAQSDVTSFSQADSDCRFAAAVAGFGMRLRQSPYAGNITLDAIAEIASAAIGNDAGGHRAEFVDLVRRAKSLQSNAGE